MNNIIKELYDITNDFFTNSLINKNITSLYNFIYLSNESTLDYLYKQEPNNDTINICHTMKLDLTLGYLSKLEKYFKIKFDSDYTKKTSKYAEFQIFSNNKNYNIIIKHEDKSEKLYPLENLHLDLNDSAIYYYKDGINLQINDISKFIDDEIINENFIEMVFSNYFIVFKLIYGYVKYNIKEFESIIDKFVLVLESNRKYRKNIRHQIELGRSNINNEKIYNYLLSFGNRIGDFNKIIETKYNLLNKILYDIDTYCSYGIDINDIEDYLTIVFLNKFKIITPTYSLYLKKYVGDCIISDEKVIEDEFDDVLLNDFFIDKIGDYRILKNKINQVDLDKYLVGLEPRKIFYIKNMFSLLLIIFYTDSNIKYNFELIKLGYMIKKFSYLKDEFMRKSLKIYNQIIKYLNLKNVIKEDSYFYSICFNKKLLYFEITKTCDIPIIRKKFEEDEDIIDIEDFQDIFILLYEFMIKNLINIDELQDNDLDLYFESQMSNFRSNKMVKLNKRRKRSYHITTDEENTFFKWLGLDKKEINVVNSIIDKKKDESLDDFLIDNINNINPKYSKNKDDDIDNEADNEDEEEDEEEDEDDEDDDSDYNSYQIKNMMYRLKYERYKISYLKLKLIDKILERDDFEIRFLDGYNEISEELIEKLLNKYNMKINFNDDTSESSEQD